MTPVPSLRPLNWEFGSPEPESRDLSSSPPPCFEIGHLARRWRPRPRHRAVVPGDEPGAGVCVNGWEMGLGTCRGASERLSPGWRPAVARGGGTTPAGRPPLLGWGCPDPHGQGWGASWGDQRGKKPPPPIISRWWSCCQPGASPREMLGFTSWAPFLHRSIWLSVTHPCCRAPSQRFWGDFGSPLSYAG